MFNIEQTFLCLKFSMPSAAACPPDIRVASEKVHVMNRDQVHGRTQQFKGKLKEVTGRLVGDESLELEGVLENTAGKVRSAYGDTKDRLRKRAF